LSARRSPFKRARPGADAGSVSDLSGSEAISVGPDADGRAVLIMRGRLGTADAGPLWQAARELLAGGKDLLLDCRELEHLGGAPMQVLLALRLELERRGARLALSGLSPGVTRTLAFAGITGDLTAP
jgi:anti-anti-sigma regulatory factor